MSLIQCRDCGSQISDSAAACPKCGAPVPVTVGPDQIQCPFCMTPLHKNATVCTGCNAMRGYATNANGVMTSKGPVVAFGIVLPIIVALVVLPFYWPVSLAIAAFAAFGTWRVKNGPYWYKSKVPT